MVCEADDAMSHKEGQTTRRYCAPAFTCKRGLDAYFWQLPDLPSHTRSNQPGWQGGGTGDAPTVAEAVPVGHLPDWVDQSINQLIKQPAEVCLQPTATLLIAHSLTHETVSPWTSLRAP